MKRTAQILIVAIVAISMYSCYHFPILISGTGPVVTREFTLAPFDEIVDETVIDVEIVQGDTQKVVAEGNENMMNFIELKVIGDKLYVDLVDGSYSNFELKLYVTVPTVKEIELESTGNITVEGFSGLQSLKLRSNSTGNIKTEGVFEIDGNLEVVSHSTGNISVNVNCDEIEARASSTGSITIEGNCAFQDVSLNGTGNYNAFDLFSEECDVVTNGTGDAKVNVSDQLDVTIRSVGSVYYKGNPRINVQDSSIGSLVHAN